MRSTRTVGIVILLLACIGNIHAQDNQQLIFQQVTERDGLSNSIVNGIAKDREGFMWIATFDGLNRYDGTHFTIFRTNRDQPYTISQNTVHSVCVDRDDNIWCATQSGISCFRKKKQLFENYFPESKASNATFSDIVCDAKGNIWCSGNLGLYKFSPGKNTFIRTNTTDELPGTHIHKRGLVLSPDGKGIWLATQKGINYYDFADDQFYNYRNNPAKLTVFDSLTHYPLAIDRQGKLLYGRERPDAIMQYDPATNELKTLDILFSRRKNGTAPPSTIFVDRDNRYWISTWGYTPFLYDPATKQVQEFYQNKEMAFSVSGDFFWHAMQDEDGTLWLGTVNGLSYINEDVNFYRLYEPLKNAGPSRQYRGINRYFEDSKGNWWFTCFDIYDLHQYDPVTGALRIFPLSKDFGIRGFNQVGDHLLANTNTGIRGFNMTAGKPEDIPAFAGLKKLIGAQPVYWLRKINDSIVCVMTELSGLIQYNISANTYKRVSLEENGFLGRNINGNRGVVVTNDQKLYIAFTPLKLARYDLATNRLDSLPVSVSDKLQLLDGPAMSMKADQRGNLWIALKETGLIRYNIEKKETSLWQQSDGLVFNQLFDLAFDSFGKTWIAAYNKFSVFDSSRNSFENFTLPISENNFAYGSRLLRLKNGNILGNIDKTFIVWLPAKFARHTTDHRVLINRLIVHDSSVSVSPGDAISFPHANNNIAIEFGVLTGLPKNRYTVEYKLDGFDEKWIQAGPLHTAVYNSLPEKTFVFRVRAVSADRSWTSEETMVTIGIVPPFHRTQFFRIAAALVLVALIALLIRFRISHVRKTEKRNSELNKMISGWRLKALRAQMNPHFIFNCMNSIDLYILKNDAENASRYLNKFAKLVRLILSQSDEMYVPLSKELEMLEYYIELEKLRFEQPFTHAIEIGNDIDAGDIEIPSMLLQPYVENAILHGLRHKQGQGHLLISIQRKESALCCVIEDNGIGRTSALAINQSALYRHDSKGSEVTAERLALLNVGADKSVIDIIDLEDEQGKPAGTRVQINIPFEFGY